MTAGEDLGLRWPKWMRRAETQGVGSSSRPAAPSRCSGRIFLSHAIEGSIMHAPDSLTAFPAYVVAGRKRQATCSDAAWFRGDHLAVANMYGGHLRIYRLHEDSGGTPSRLELLHEKRGLPMPEGIAVSPDGAIVAAAHSLSHEYGISLHAIDGASLALGPTEALCPGRDECAFHATSFAPDGRHIAYTVIGRALSVEVVRLKDRAMTCRLDRFPSALAPKSITFSADGRFALVALSFIAGPTDSGKFGGGMLRVHRFDAESGSLQADPVAEYQGRGTELGFLDMAIFLPGASGGTYRILVTDQGNGLIPAFSFDAADRTVRPDGVLVDQLSFPHGIDARADGRYVAITTFGDDSVHIASPGDPDDISKTRR
jgi:DNA-binding beta-propeller fold protein YncE